MSDLFLSCRKLLLTAAVHNMCLRTKSKGRAGSIHGYVSAADNHALLRTHDRCAGLLGIGSHQIGTGQELIGREYAESLLTRNVHEAGKSCTRADKDSIKAFLVHQILNRGGVSDNTVGLDGNTESLYILDFLGNNTLLRKTELRNSIDKYAAGLVKRLKNANLIAKLCQISCAGKTGRACSDHSNLLPVRYRVVLRTNAKLLGGICRISFQLADGNCLTLDSADALCFALTLLRADTSADSRKSGGLADDFIRALYVFFLQLRNKSGNVNGDRASLHALRVLAVQASGCLCLCLFLVIAKTYFFKIRCTDLRILFTDRDLLHHINLNCHIRSFLAAVSLRQSNE